MSKLSHLNDKGEAHMVDVSEKDVTSPLRHRARTGAGGAGNHRHHHLRHSQER